MKVEGDEKDLSIVILNWNNSALLNDVLQSVITSVGGFTYAVTVIDNASTDGGFSLVNDEFISDKNFHFIQNRINEGWIAINRILFNTKSKYILNLDADATLHNDTLRELIHFLSSHKDVGAVTAKFLNPDGSPQYYYRRIMTPFFFVMRTFIGHLFDKYIFNLYFYNHYRYHSLNLNQVSEVEQPAWPCLLWRRDALDSYIVDSDFPFYFPDVEMSTRLYKKGYRIFLIPSATITHLKSTSYSKANKAWKEREYYRGLFAYFKKHYPYWFVFIWLIATIDRALKHTFELFTKRSFAP